MKQGLLPVATVLGLSLTALQPALAAVSAEEAAKLKGELTPFGAERAGNNDGSIPAWTGGYTTPLPGDKPGGRRGDPFASDKPLYAITAKNMATYADKLTDGTKALLQKYPDTFRVDVYPTRRTAAAPQWVMDNTVKNATRAKLSNGAVENAFGGIPFPVPKSGAEVMWNHTLRWRGSSWQFMVSQYQITTDGRAVLTSEGFGDQQMPYYLPESHLEQFEKEGRDIWLLRLVNSGPPIRAGEALVARNNIDPVKDQGWVYLTGQRRVRKIPTPCCDTPTPASAGLMTVDEIETWAGRLDRFDWKIIGKSEMIVPYNTNKLMQPKSDAEVLAPHHLKPDFVRWELHRVWVVEATLKAGQRHLAAKSRYYCDEDTWTCVLGDRWDAHGQLWRTLFSYPFVAPDIPASPVGTFGFYDVISGTGLIGNLYNSKPAQYTVKSRYDDAIFTPDAMVGASVR
jgi:hypothetical protein